VVVEHEQPARVRVSCARRWGETSGSFRAIPCRVLGRRPWTRLEAASRAAMTDPPHGIILLVVLSSRFWVSRGASILARAFCPDGRPSGTGSGPVLPKLSYSDLLVPTL
jgi:hypothetical protein